MLLYNLTLNAETAEVEKTETWIQEVFLQTLKKEKGYMAYKLLELIKEKENEGRTFSLQVYFDDYSGIQKFLAQQEPLLINQLRSAFGEKVMEFRTLLRVIDSGINE